MDGPRKIADTLTLIRALLGPGMLWVALTQGADGLALVCGMMILSWTTDYFDGFFARRSTDACPSWLGRHDLQVDVLASLGLAAYLLIAGFIDAWVLLAYFAAWALIFWLWGFRRPLQMLMQTFIYVALIWFAWRQEPLAAGAMIAWIVGALALTWPRFPKEVIPGFFQGIGLIWQERRH